MRTSLWLFLLFWGMPVLPGGELIPWSNAGWCWTYEGPRLPAIDRNLYGKEITIAGKSFQRGIAGHTPFTVFFHLGGLADSLSGFIGIDDAAHPLDPSGEDDTAVDAVILSDRREVYRHTVRLNEKAVFFQLDLRGVQHLELRGEYGKHFFKQRIVFADLQFESEAPEKLYSFALRKKVEYEAIKKRKIIYPPAPKWEKISIRRNQNEYVIDNGAIRLHLYPELGGRISGFSSSSGTSFLLPSTSFKPEELLERGRSKDFGGGHFMRPEPRNYFLPSDPVLKYAPYSIEFPAEGKIIMTSPPSYDLLLQYSYVIDMKVGMADFILLGRITNIAPFSQRLGVWSITRLANDYISGIAFGEGEKNRISYPIAFSKSEKQRLDQTMKTEDAILTAELNDGTIFRKRFLLPGGLLHLFVNKNFTELEYHTPIQQVESGQSVVLTEQWGVEKQRR
ncbi:MAG: hypothetical protein HPZ91_01395 [Lentisphaeria bacterium]|nr:hypothetical protein [Lentisphaeria bacterium]